MIGYTTAQSLNELECKKVYGLLGADVVHLPDKNEDKLLLWCWHEDWIKPRQFWSCAVTTAKFCGGELHFPAMLLKQPQPKPQETDDPADKKQQKLEKIRVSVLDILDDKEHFGDFIDQLMPVSNIFSFLSISLENVSLPRRDSNPGLSELPMHKQSALTTRPRGLTVYFITIFSICQLNRCNLIPLFFFFLFLVCD